MSELKPCPFCGGEAETHEVGFPYHYWDVWCDGECFDHFCEKPTEAEAIEAWNTRAEQTCKVEGDYWHDHGGDGYDTYEYVLSCGHKVEWLDDDEEPKYCPRCGARVLRNTPKYSETDAKEACE